MLSHACGLRTPQNAPPGAANRERDGTTG